MTFNVSPAFANTLTLADIFIRICITITLQEYLAKIPKNKTVLVDFGAIWCAPCKKMAQVLDSLVARHDDKFVLVKIEGSNQINICKELNVDGFPTFMIYKQGKEFWRKQGITELKEFLQYL